MKLEALTEAAVTAVPPPLILRRAEFICKEIVSGVEKPDQVINVALRVISNWVTIGADGTSESVKRRNRHVSEAALNLLMGLLKTNSKKEAIKLWHDHTTNEHPEPLSMVWIWLREEPRTPMQLIERMSLNKFVTVTKTEDAAINKQGNRFKGAPNERYAYIVQTVMPEEFFQLLQRNSRAKK